MLLFVCLSIFPFLFVLFFGFSFSLLGFVFCFVLLLFDSIDQLFDFLLLHRPGWSQTHKDPPPTASPGLGLLVCASHVGPPEGFEVRKTQEYAGHQIPRVKDCRQVAKLTPQPPFPYPHIEDKVSPLSLFRSIDADVPSRLDRLLQKLSFERSFQSPPSDVQRKHLHVYCCKPH